MKKLVLGITSPGSVPLIRGQAQQFKEWGYDVYLMCPKEERSLKYCQDEGCKLIDVDITRYITPFKDLITFYKILVKLNRLKPDIVNVGTPKMGLLGSMASWILGVKKRVYTCRGFRYEHEKGLKKKILQYTERISGCFSHKVICIAPSLREKAIKDSIFKKKKIEVINKGSSNGINLEKYNPSKIDDEQILVFREKYGLKNSLVFGYVGRLVDRKGINELYEAFNELSSKHKRLKLLVVGNPDIKQLYNKNILEKYHSHENIICAGWHSDIPVVMSSIDVFVMPAWWEGFGNSYIEAAAMAKPVIGTSVTGAKDAVKDGFNGLLVPSKKIDALKMAMEFYIKNPDKISQHGKNGIVWAKNFQQIKIWKGLDQIYRS